MHKLLARIFIKDHNNLDDPKVRNNYGVLASVFGIIMNTMLSAAKITIGAITASVAVIADGINNLSDMASSGISLVGFKMSNRPADKDHPFGHARMEYISSLIIAFLIIFVGVQLAITSVEAIIDQQQPSINIFIYIILGASIAVKIVMAMLYRSYYKLIHSTTLKACAVDSINDCITTALVLIGMIITDFSGVNLDGYIGIAVSLYIVISGIKLIKETLSPLLGEKPNPEFIKDIVDKVREYDKILGIHDLVCHNYGANNYFVTFHAEVDAASDLMESHELIDQLEKELSSKIIHVVIHLDPIVINDKRVNDLREMVRAVLYEISPNLNMHDFRAIIGPSRKNLIFDVLLPDHTSFSEKIVKKVITDKVISIDPTCTLVIIIDYPYVGMIE